jgi:GntR family transcriptional regulator
VRHEPAFPAREPLLQFGELRPGAALRSITRPAQEHELATVTVRKALAILKREGLIETVPGYGTFVKQRDC